MTQSIQRRQFDNLPQHVKECVYFENQGNTEHTSYYYTNQRGQKTPTESLHVAEDHWYILYYSS